MGGTLVLPSQQTDDEELNQPAENVDEESGGRLVLPGDAAHSSNAQQGEEKPGFFKRLGEAVGAPTSLAELQTPHKLSAWDIIPPGPRQAAQQAVDYAKTAYQGVKSGLGEEREALSNIAEGQPVAPNVGKFAHGALHQTLQATPIVGPPLERAGEDVAAKNYSGAAGGMTGTLIDYLGLRAGGEKANETEAEATARNAEKGSAKIKKALATPAGKGGARAAEMDRAIADTQSELASLQREQAVRKPGRVFNRSDADAYHDLAEKIDKRQDEIWKYHDEMVDRAAERNYEINPANVQRAARQVLTREARAVNPAEARAAEEWLSGIANIKDVKGVDNMIREINSDLRGKNVLGYGPLQIRVRQAAVRALRQELDATLTRAGETGVADINRRWGALDQIKNRVAERAVQLANQEAKAGKIPEWVHIYTLLHPEALAVGASIRAASLLRPRAGRQLVSGLNTLADTALERPNAPVPPTLRPIRGLLPPARIQLGPSMESPSIPHPPEPMLREPLTQVQRNAKTGRMQRVYTAASKPLPIGQTAEGPIYPPAEPPPFRAPQIEERRNAANLPRASGAIERRTYRGPDPMREAYQRSIQNVIDDPTASARDKAIARAQLADMRANKFEVNEPIDLNKIRAENAKTKTAKPSTRSSASQAKITYRTDSNGTRWARRSGSDTEISVPNRLKGDEADSYAREKLDLQDKFKRSRTPNKAAD